MNLEKSTVAMCMPAFNEAKAIEFFLREIFESFNDIKSLSVVVVNDFSGDDTSAVLNRIAQENPALSVIHNITNLGHGTSTLLGLERGMSTGAEYIISCDGDGHILGSELKKLLSVLVEGNFDVVEGVRYRPTDKWFRKLVSLATRFLVWNASGIAPKDANTPFRVYKRSTLSTVLEKIPLGTTIPNLVISKLSRLGKLRLHEEVVSQIVREGTVQAGSTWKQRFSFLPSRRFLVFCIKATTQWFTRTKG